MVSCLDVFIQNYKQQIKAFTPSLRSAYTRSIVEYRQDPRCEGFESIDTNEGLSDPSIRGATHRYHWWFPTHFFKFQDALIRWEEECRKIGEPFLFDLPKVTFIDLGCGSGAASFGIISLLEQYQAFKRNRNSQVSLVRINLIGLDPNEAELEIYENLFSKYLTNIKESSLEITMSTVREAFPSGLNELLQVANTGQGHVLIIGMSNLIKWIWNEVDPHLSEGNAISLLDLEAEEADALSEIFRRTDFDKFHVVGVATQSRKYRFLPEKLSELIRRVLLRYNLSGEPLGKRWGTKAKVLFSNPEGSRWIRKYPTGGSTYFIENIIATSDPFNKEKALLESLNNLYLEPAWIKAHNYSMYESLVDRVELKLFECDYDQGLADLRSQCLDRNYQFLNQAFDLPYLFPKNESSQRPKSLSRLEELIIAVAIILRFKDQIKGQLPDVDYSFKLARIKSEYLYEYWYQQYVTYISDVLSRLDHNQVCTTDIKSFYSNINQKILLELLSTRLKESPRCFQCMQSIIERDCHHDHVEGYGLLQGHAISGPLSSVMLQPFDLSLIRDRGITDRYSRFADDITVTGISSNNSIEDIEELQSIRQELFRLDPALELNNDKTRLYSSAHDYRVSVGGMQDLDDISARFRTLFLPLYTLNRSYRNDYRIRGILFAYQYQRILASIGIHLRPEWLSRKLDEYSSPLRLLRSIYLLAKRNGFLRWPPLSLLESKSGREAWLASFTNKNDQWVVLRDQLFGDLEGVFLDSCRLLQEAALDVEKSKQEVRRLKFAIYRLSVLGIDGIHEQIGDLLLSQPWHVPMWISTRALARGYFEDTLLRVAENSDSPYVRAIIFKSLGLVKTRSSAQKLASILDTSELAIEKLMASEALIA